MYYFRLWMPTFCSCSMWLELWHVAFIMAPGPCRPAALCDVCKFRYHVKAAAPAAPVMKTAIKKAAAPAAPMPSRLFTKAIADVKREKAMPKAAAPAAPVMKTAIKKAAAPAAPAIVQKAIKKTIKKASEGRLTLLQWSALQMPAFVMNSWDDWANSTCF